ncbi:MAG: hypothetical protein F2842_05435 [Actinobacteria bacterium]|uniref:Unannotated protein n=1 Tax=freshwater metagenome TaxID=449393 RepID=A0A6J7JMA5_9ZZZZ|nr:hypothetical protein [Actinomycetota bacterium]
MLISLDRRFVYVHIYKTAGSSLTAMLAPYVSPEMRSDTPRVDGPGWQGTWHYDSGQHSRLEPQLTPLIESGQVDGDVRVLAVVRNPYTWQHSIWSRFYAEGTGGYGTPFAARYPSCSFEDYLRHQLSLEGRDQFDFWGALPQASFLRTEHPVHYVLGRFESLNESIPRMLAAVGIEAGDIPHENRQQHRVPVARAFTDTAVRLVNELAAEDFDLFSYSKVSSAEELLAQSHRTSSDPRS